MKRGFRIWCARVLSLFALTLWVPSLVSAQAKRVVVRSFHGPSAGVARNHVVSALKSESEVELVPSDSFEGLSGQGLRDAAAEAGVSAIFEGKTRKKGKLLVVTVSVRNAASGDTLHDQDWTRKKNQLGEIRDNFWSIMGPSVRKSEVPERRAPEPEVEKPAPRPTAEERPKPTIEKFAREEKVAVRAEEEPEPEPEPSVPGDKSAAHPALVAALGGRMMWRELSYDSDTSLNRYSSYGRDDGSPGVSLALQLQLFPGAFSSNKWASNLGIEAGGDITLGLQSKQTNVEYKTTAYNVEGGLVYRLPFEIFEPQFRVGYLLQTFKVQNAEALGVPPVKYQALRIGAGVILRLVEMFHVDVAFGALPVLDAGPIGKKRYASKLGAFGWEVGGGVSVYVKQVYGIRAGAEFRRYQLDFNKSESKYDLPKKGTDDYLRATLSFVYVLPGVK